eukprot:1253011-Rhodomonas_salina.3
MSFFYPAQDLATLQPQLAIARCHKTRPTLPCYVVRVAGHHAVRGRPRSQTAALFQTRNL